MLSNTYFYVEKYIQSQRLFIHFKLSTAANTLTFCVCRSLCVTWFMRPAIPSNGQLSGNRRESIFPRGTPNSYISGSRPRILSRTECNVHQESIIHVSQKPKPFPRVEVTWAMPEKNIKFLVMSSLMTMETILATSPEPKIKSQKVSQIMWENQPTSCI